MDIQNLIDVVQTLTIVVFAIGVKLLRIRIKALEAEIRLSRKIGCKCNGKIH